MRSVVLACEHACAGARPDRRRVTRHPSRTSAVTTERTQGTREEGRCTTIGKRRKERRERRCRPWGRRHKRIASHATELNPPLKFTLLRRSLSRVQGCPNLTNAPRDERRDVPTSESISESGLDSNQRFAYDN